MSIKSTIFKLGLLLSLLLSHRLVFAQDCPRLCQAMQVAGDMIINNTRAQAARLPIGTTGQILLVNSSGIPEWGAALPVSTFTSLTGTATLSTIALNADTKGLLLAGGSQTTNDPSKGAQVRLYGVNEGTFAGNGYFESPGNLTVVSGTGGASRTITFATANLNRWQFDGSGLFVQNATNGGKIQFNSATTAILESTGAGSLTIATTAAQQMDFKTNALVRWSFTGSSGHLYQDSTNGGDLIMPKASTGLIVGTTARSSDITVVDTPSFYSYGSTGLISLRGSADANSSNIDFLKSRATDGTADTIVNSGDSLGTLLWYGADGAAFRPAASIVGNVDTTPGSSDMPGRLTFNLSADGGITLNPALILYNNKNAEFYGTVTSTRTTDIGWSVVNVANQACNTTCTSACVVGIDTLGTGGFLGCAVATADSCICAGAS